VGRTANGAPRVRGENSREGGRFSLKKGGKKKKGGKTGKEEKKKTTG